MDTPTLVPAPPAPARVAFDAPPSLFERLARRYAEPHRRYHTWAHVLACLDARRRITAASLPEVDLALLFHDAVYEPLAYDNEARSAALLVEEGRCAWLSEPLLERARPLVLATRHGAGALDVLDTEEACIVADADLSILAADASTFAAYEAGVRQEYASVDDAAYAAGRGDVLRAFLEQPAIYATRPAQRAWEGAARKNIESSLTRLASPAALRAR